MLCKINCGSKCLVIANSPESWLFLAGQRVSYYEAKIQHASLPEQLTLPNYSRGFR
jgi:hypothetical protein